MHPDMTGALARGRQDELMERARASRRTAGVRGGVPRWHVTWSRATLAAAGASGRRGRSWVIIISATRRA